MDQLRFSIPEILSLFGVAQSVYILAYMAFRAGRLSRAGLPMAYFLILGLGFAADSLDGALSHFFPWLYLLQWLGWFAGPPLGVMLIVQIAQINQTPALRHYWVLLLLPLAFMAAALSGLDARSGCTLLRPCREFLDALTVAGLLAGAASLLTIWINRGIFAALHGQKIGKDRYWLCLALIIMNVFFLAIMLLSLNDRVDPGEIIVMRTVLGLGLVYLAGTSLFRIYPQAVLMLQREQTAGLTHAEQVIARKIEDLLALEKVYQEPTYSRADLAREVGVSEAVLSRIINTHFKKSFPQLLNDLRVADAKRLIEETEANVSTIAEEVGFNSLATFNRVFKDTTGVSPTEFRKRETGLH